MARNTSHRRCSVQYGQATLQALGSRRAVAALRQRQSASVLAFLREVHALLDAPPPHAAPSRHVLPHLTALGTALAHLSPDLRRMTLRLADAHGRQHTLHVLLSARSGAV